MKLYMFMVLGNLAFLGWLYWSQGPYVALLAFGLWVSGYVVHKHRSYLRSVAEMKAHRLTLYTREKIHEWFKS